MAIAALLAVAVGWLSGPRENGSAGSPGTGDDPPPTTTTQPAKALEAIDVPVTENVVVRSPRLGRSARYHQDGTVVVVRLTMDTCVRRDGLLEAAGRIRNDSSLGQIFDYGIHMDFRRSLAGPPLAEVDTVIESLRPGETAEWSVSAASTRVVSLRCDITKLDVSPVDDAS